jgi:hypothetical protein
VPAAVACAGDPERTLALYGARIVGGKLVVNVLPGGAPHKGVALLDTRRGLGCETALYVGDDDTDEDVFQLGDLARLVSVRVGGRAGSAVTYFILRQRDVEVVLARWSRAGALKVNHRDDPRAGVQCICNRVRRRREASSQAVMGFRSCRAAMRSPSGCMSPRRSQPWSRASC